MSNTDGTGKKGLTAYDGKPLTPAETQEAKRTLQPVPEPSTAEPFKAEDEVTSLKIPQGETSLDPDFPNYDMTHQIQGYVVVFNHYEVEGFEKRDGTDKDVARIKKTFQSLDFEVKVYDDLTYSEITSKLDDLSKNQDYTDHNCLIIFMLTHGTRNGLIMAKDAMYAVDAVWNRFTADKCTTLAGKPKMFFVQACRGDNYDRGTNMRRRSKTQTDSANISASYKIPSHADILVGQSTFEDFASWRNVEEGSWYIQCLCEVLNRDSQRDDLLTMMTTVARKVATEHRSDGDNVHEHDMVQTTTVTSTLMRKIYLKRM